MFFIQKMNIVLHNWTCIISVHRDVKGKQPLLLSENSHVRISTLSNAKGQTNASLCLFWNQCLICDLSCS